MADRKKMEGHCSTGQSPQWAVVQMEEEDEEEEEHCTGASTERINRTTMTASRRSAREVASDCTRTSAGPATIVVCLLTVVAFRD